MDTILAALQQTPWWVYLLFFYLLKIGFGATKTCVVSMKKMVILPLIFTALSIHTMIASFRVTATIFLIWFFSIALGSLIGYLLVRHFPYRVDKKKQLIEMPGTWLTLIFILLIFFAKYFFGYEISADPMLLKNTVFEFALLGTSGVVTGLFIGRLICYLNEFRVGQSVDLKETK